MGTTDPSSHQYVACAVCLKEIPHSEAKQFEAQDYVAYFCGLDCFDQWRRQHNTDEQTPPPTDPAHP